MIYYVVVSVILSVFAWRTGGLESGIAVHVCINTLAFVYGLFTADLSKSFEREKGAGSPMMLLFIPAAAVMAFGLELAFRRLGARLRLHREFQPSGTGLDR